MVSKKAQKYIDRSRQDSVYDSVGKSKRPAQYYLDAVENAEEAASSERSASDILYGLAMQNVRQRNRNTGGSANTPASTKRTAMPLQDARERWANVYNNIPGVNVSRNAFETPQEKRAASNLFMASPINRGAVMPKPKKEEKQEKKKPVSFKLTDADIEALGFAGQSMQMPEERPLPRYTSEIDADIETAEGELKEADKQLMALADEAVNKRGDPAGLNDVLNRQRKIQEQRKLKEQQVKALEDEKRYAADSMASGFVDMGHIGLDNKPVDFASLLPGRNAFSSERVKELNAQGERNPEIMAALTKAAESNPNKLTYIPTAGGEDETLNERVNQINHMTKDELTVYNGLPKEEAERYFDSIKEELNRRIANEEYAGIKDSGIDKSFYVYSAGVQKGLEGLADVPSFVTGSTKRRPESAQQMTSAMIRQDAGNAIESAWYDILSSTGYMTPGIVAAPFVGGTAGNIVFGLSQAGNAYREAINEGRSVRKAQAYGAQQAVDEAATNWLLGGIGAFGGGAMTDVLKNTAIGQAALTGLDDMFRTMNGKINASIITDFLMDAGSEAAQEFLQYFTEGFTKQILYGENVDLSDPQTWKDAGYAALLGALNAGFLNAPATAAKLTNQRAVNNYIHNELMAKLDVDEETAYELFDAINAMPTNQTNDGFLREEDTLTKEERASVFPDQAADVYKEHFNDEASGAERAEYDQNMHKAYEAGKAGESLEDSMQDESFAQFYAENAEAVHEMHRVGFMSGDGEIATPESIEDISRRYGERAAAVANEYYDGGDEADYAEYTAMAYEAGLSGASLDAIKDRDFNDFRKTLPEAVDAMYEAGREAANESSSRSREWDAGMDGFLGSEGVQGEGSQRRTEQEQRAAETRAAAQDQGTESVKASAVIKGGADEDVAVLSKEFVKSDKRLAKIAAENASKGIRTTFIIGNMKISEDGETFEVRGAISKDGKHIVVRADHPVWSPEQINNHERFHAEKKRNSAILENVRKRINRDYSDAEIDALAERYAEAYSLTNADADYIFEEMCADIYAGMDAFEGKLTELAPYVNEAVQESRAKKDSERGPPKFSKEQNSFGLLKYNEKEIKLWENSTFSIDYANSEQDIEDFVNNVIKTGVNKRLYCGRITKDLGDRIYKDTGVAVESYNVAITSSFENSHADSVKEGKRGQVAITPDIVAKFPTVISDYDSVKLSSTKDGAPALEFRKNISGDKVVVANVVKRRQMLVIQTMYGWALKKGSPHATNAGNATSAITPKATMGANPSINKITQIHEESNQMFSREIPGQLSIEDLEKQLGVNISNQTPAQREMSAKALKATSSLRDIEGKPVTTGAAITITKELLNNGKTELIGKTAKTPADMAAIAQVYRDPRYETCRYFFTDKNGKIVFQTGVSSHLPAAAFIFPSEEAFPDYMTRLVAAAKDAGAENVYMLHNHPSGSVDPSGEDLAASMFMKSQFDIGRINFKGSIVIDHTQYANIDCSGSKAKEGVYNLPKKAVTEDGETYRHSVRNPLLGINISSPGDIANIAKAEKLGERRKDTVSLFFTDARHNVRVIQECGNEYVKDTNKFIAHMKKTAKQYGCAKLFAVTGDTETYRGPLTKLFKDGLMLDVVYMSGVKYPVFRSLLEDTGFAPGEIFKDTSQYKAVRVGSAKFSRDITEESKGRKLSEGQAEAEDNKEKRIAKSKGIDTENVDAFVNQVVQNKGRTNYKRNQVRVANIPVDIADNVKKATEGRVDISQKRLLFEGGKLYHELVNHFEEYGPKDIYKIIDTVMDPDLIEDISSKDALDQRDTIGFAKSFGNELVVIAAVGGKNNYGLFPEEILRFNQETWDRYQKEGKTLKEIIYKQSSKRTYTEDDIKRIKKNRVTAARYESNDSSAHTSETVRRFPLSDNKISQIQEKSNSQTKLSRDTEGRSLSKGQQEYFKDSKIRDEEGNLVRAYHGTSEDFTVFDRTKGRSTMDIQGSFFSPWSIDAEGYGPNVKTVYLNITNPAPESVAYKALNRFKGQNDAGVKAREYLISLGYDGVNNNDEEYIAFYPEQVKDINNLNPSSNPDIRFSREEAIPERTGRVSKALQKRDRGEMLSESQFYQVYSAHKLNLRKQDNLQEQIENIKAEGFKGDGGFGNNVMPASINPVGYTEEEMLKRGYTQGNIDWKKENQKDHWRDGRYYPSINVMQGKYGAKKGDTVLFVPNEDLDRSNEMERVKPGYIPPFDYEFVTVERDFQPYYELYKKAYEKYAKEKFSRDEQSFDGAFADVVASIAGQKATADSASKAIAYNIKRYNAKDIDKKKLAEDLSGIYESLSEGRLRPEEALEELKKIAGEIYDHQAPGRVPSPYDMFKGYFKKTRLYVNDTIKGDIADYNEWRKRNLGYLTLVNDPNAIGVDSYYSELSDMYPGIFPADIWNPTDQLERILEVAKLAKEGIQDDSFLDMTEEDYEYELSSIALNLLKGFTAEKAAAADNAAPAEKAPQSVATLNKRIEYLEKQIAGMRDYYHKRIDEEIAKRLEYREREALKKFNKETREKLLKEARKLSKKKGDADFRARVDALIGDLDLVAVGIRNDTAEALEDLREQVEKLAAEDPDYAVLEKPRWERLYNRIKKTHIRDMDIEDVIKLTEQIVAMKHEQEVKDRQIKDVLGEKTATMGRRAVKQQQILRKMHMKGRFWNNLRKYALYMESPQRAGAMLDGYQSNGVYSEHMAAINEGQTKGMTFRMNAQKRFDKVLTDELVKDWAKNDIEITDANGKKVKISKGMRMALYLHAKNAQNLAHIGYSGITVPGEEDYKKGDYANAYTSSGTRIQFTTSQERAGRSDEAAWERKIRTLAKRRIDEITSSMTADEKAFADAAFEFFNKDCKNAINATSLLLNGYEKAVVDNYFPIRTDPNFTQRDMSGLALDGTIEGMGMLKERIEGASNPILLEDIAQVIQRQTNNVAKYYGLAIPVRNFNKFLNYQSTGYGESTKQATTGTWRTEGMKYIEDLLKDIQTGREYEGTVLDRLKSLYAGTTLNLNFGVALKQTASAPFAAVILDGPSVAKAFAKNAFSKADIDYMDSITPWGWARRQGMSGTEIGEVYRQKNLIEQNTAFQKLKNRFNWIQGVDVWTTNRLFFASEYYVQEHFPEIAKLGRGNELYDAKVAEVYNEVLQRTQPSYDVMQRNALLRSRSDLAKLIGMFKTQTFNMGGEIIDAYARLKAMDDLSKMGEVSKTEKADAHKQFGKTVIMTMLSQGMLVTLSALASAILHRMKPYRDDEGEVTAESVAGKMLYDWLTSFAGLAAGGSELQSALLYFTGREKWYDMTYPGIDMVNDLVNDIGKTFSAAGTEKFRTRALALAMSISKMFRIPSSNVYNLLNAINLHLQDYRAGELGSFDAGAGLLGLTDTSVTKEQYANRAVSAFRRGDIEKGSKALRNTNKSSFEKAIGSKISQSLFDRFLEDGANAANYIKYVQGGQEPELSGVTDQGYTDRAKLYEAAGDPERNENWHHIVEQEQADYGLAGFSQDQVQNLNNIVSLPSGSKSVHTAITNYYNSVQDFTDGKTVRQWLADKSFEEQWNFGIRKLREYGDVLPTNDGWVFVPDSAKIEELIPKKEGTGAPQTAASKLSVDMKASGITGNAAYGYVIDSVQSKAITAEDAAEWFESNAQRTGSKTFKSWQNLGKPTFEYIKHRADIGRIDEKYDGDKRAEMTGRYIKNNVKTLDEKKVLWEMAGFDVYKKDGKTYTDSFRKNVLN